MPAPVIASAARSPIGRARKGTLVDLRPDDLAAHVAAEALRRAEGLDPAHLDDLLLGCAQPAGEQGYNLARAVALLLGRPSLPGATINRYCASSLQALRSAAHAIAAGEARAQLVVGVECVSRYDRGKADGMEGTRNPRLDTLYMPMGETAEVVAAREQVSRAEQDGWAAMSQQRAVLAWERGLFAGEVVPVPLPDGSVASSDDCPRPGTTAEGLAKLEPAFRPTGTVTAGNCCPLNDGAAALVVTSESWARAQGLPLLARIRATAVSALAPEHMGLGPVEASQRALGRAGLTVGDLDAVEMNEAFAAQVIPCVRHLGLNPELTNVWGGAIALGHPFGMTGARLVTTLLSVLRATDGTLGLATLCVGGGQGMAVVVERIS